MLIKKIILPSDDNRWKLINATMKRHGYQPNCLIETMHTVQETFGYLDEISLKFVAFALKVPLSSVFGVATFYNFFNLKPQGKHTCVVCLGTACYIKGTNEIAEEIKKEFKIGMGKTTEDGQVSLLSARCLGACGIAPAVVIDGEVHGNVSTRETVETLRRLAYAN
ncbi:MAG: bidirectional hydrogenase complex protein HoxE [Ignavibacteria bacterium]|nr:bidirectional hydrogenase complex protein HoxE [Ignavibacteria bacterium]